MSTQVARLPRGDILPGINIQMARTDSKLQVQNQASCMLALQGQAKETRQTFATSNDNNATTQAIRLQKTTSNKTNYELACR